KSKLIKKVEVSRTAVERQPANKAYLVDVTRKDAVFNVAADVDRNRVRVKTSKGIMTLAEVLRKANRPTTGAVRIGLTSAIRNPTVGTFPGTQGTALVSCEGLLCTCTGDVDCNDMFTNYNCGDLAGCDERGCWCLKSL
ncbi:MAG: hypothetical protein ABIP75_08695, partial [Pyrinomonadaceae bacterium]